MNTQSLGRKQLEMSLLNTIRFVIKVKRNGQRTASSKWVFDPKTDEEGYVIKFKAMCVLRGISQIQGKEFDETFAEFDFVQIDAGSHGKYWVDWKTLGR